MHPSTAEDLIRQQYHLADWALVNSCLSSECEGVQWKGARILYLKLAQDPTSFAEFAEQLECQSCISKIIHMLKNPSKDPISVFALDVSASKSTQISRCTSMVRSVMQAQMARLLLSIILQLALADSVSLIQHIYKAGGLPLLRSLAMDLSEHTHPETEAAVDIKLLRQDIRAKLAQLYRLLPLAISCIYEVTSTRGIFAPQIVTMAADAANTNHRTLALQLQDHLNILQQTPLLITSLNDAANMAQRDHNMRHTGNQDVKSSKYAEVYVGQLRHAWASLFAGYGSKQSGDCLFWLFEEPERHAELATVSDVETFGALINGDGAVSEPHASVTAARQSSAPPGDGRDGSDEDERLDMRDDAEQIPEAASGLPGRSENLSGHTSDELQSVAAEEQRQGRAEGKGPGGWTTGRVVLLSVTAVSAGVLVGCYPRSMHAVDSLAHVMGTSARMCVTAIPAILDKWAEERRLARLPARTWCNEVTAGRSR